MDLSTQQVQEIQEIEKQVNPDEVGTPKILSQVTEKDRSVLINVLAALGISIVSTGAIILLMVVPFSSKKAKPPQPVVTTSTIQIQPNVVVQTEYINPFDTSSQYTNPFIASVNPFANLPQ